MMERLNQKWVIVILETCLVFALGIFGSEISEFLQIAPFWILILTSVCLILFIVINHLKNGDNHLNLFADTPKNFLGHFVPRTMAAIFPIGIVFGLTVGFWIAFVQPDILFVLHDSSGLIRSEIGVYKYEVWGVLIGFVACVVYALLVDGYLAGAFLFGYCLGLGTSTSVVRQDESTNIIIYLIFIMIGLITATLLSFSEPIFSHFRMVVTQKRA